jgi:hypothetical protein
LNLALEPIQLVKLSDRQPEEYLHGLERLGGVRKCGSKKEWMNLLLLTSGFE